MPSELEILSDTSGDDSSVSYILSKHKDSDEIYHDNIRDRIEYSLFSCNLNVCLFVSLLWFGRTWRTYEG